MKVQVKLFAAARELAGKPQVPVDVADGATVADVRRALMAELPKLQTVVSHARWAVDAEFVAENRRISAASEIALIPPVSGG